MSLHANFDTIKILLLMTDRITFQSFPFPRHLFHHIFSFFAISWQHIFFSPFLFSSFFLSLPNYLSPLPSPFLYSWGQLPAVQELLVVRESEAQGCTSALDTRFNLAGMAQGGWRPEVVKSGRKRLCGEASHFAPTMIGRGKRVAHFIRTLIGRGVGRVAGFMRAMIGEGKTYSLLQSPCSDWPREGKPLYLTFSRN